MPTSTLPTTEDDVRAIKAVIDARAHSMRAKNGAGTMATQTADYFQYPLFGVLQYAGPTATGLDYVQAAFDGFTGPIGYEVIEQTVLAGGDLGVSHSLSRISGTQASGAVLDMWFRKTLTFTRVEGTWLIAQEHESVPIAADGSAATGLTPVIAVTADALVSDQETFRLDALRRGFEEFEVRTVVRDGTRLGYRVGGEGEVVVLVHGFPQSGYTFRGLAAALARDYRVIVVDYRGAAGSDAPEGGYDKATMAEDLRAVVLDAGARRVHLVGHDIGTTVAFAYASAHEAEVATLTLFDGVVPGTPTMAMIVASGRPWHFGFHSQVALATALLSGREGIYVDWLFDTNTVDPASITPQERMFAVRALQAPGALAAASKTYAAWFTHDGPANEAFLAAHGKLRMPLLVAGGGASLGQVMPMVGADIATDVTAAIIGGGGHFLLEEQPAEVERVLRQHLAAS